MPTTIRFSFYGDVQLNRTIDRMHEAIDDFSPAFEAMAHRFRYVEVRQFNSEGRYASGGWSPLSPPYARWKLRQVGKKPILEFSGMLRRSLTKRPFGVEYIGPHLALFGSDVEYGAYHQRGSGNLPRRRPIELTEDERKRWIRIAQRFIVTGKATPNP